MNYIDGKMAMKLEVMKMIMIKDYMKFYDRAVSKEDLEWMKRKCKDYESGIEFSVGKKYIKVIRNDGQKSVWGFIVNSKDDKKFEYGDILRASGWATPARNKARGNVMKDDMDVLWTGPRYL